MVEVGVLCEGMVGDIPKSELNKKRDGNGTGGKIPSVLMERKGKIVLKDDR